VSAKAESRADRAAALARLADTVVEGRQQVTASSAWHQAVGGIAREVLAYR
jgi:hypothetical protein